ncbi:MAG: POT family MFS transporter [Phycisphaerales bacterium]|nr:POT family MFS transporter [Phycisphaerales bacterium]MDG2132309.1 POT family MFS transporter [Phycisphaerales bacterium]
MSTYLTAPVPTKKLPGGIPYIIGNEAAERFSFYGMKGILVVFMTTYLSLLPGAGGNEPMSDTDAIANYHLFTTAVYFTPILGALLSDILLGKYLTIMILSIVYCIGHGALALMGLGEGIDPGWMLFLGLGLISFGSGGIKPCVSAHVGDQFGASNGHMLSKIFGWFYFSINVGAFVSTLLTPWFLEWYGPHLAFGVPGVLMCIATFLFWCGRKKFVHVPAGGMKWFRETFSWQGISAILKLGVIYVFVAVFWALFDQTGSSWVLQAEDLDRDWLGVTWLASQIQAVNPIMILIYIPLFTFIVYPLINKVFKLTPIRKISIGLFVMVVGFAMVSIVQASIDAGLRPSIGWQIAAYAILTASEVMVSITCLEFSYTQAPKTMKSVIMALFLISVSLGNLFTAGVNSVILMDSNADGVKAVASAIANPEEGSTLAPSAIAEQAGYRHESIPGEGFAITEAGVDGVLGSEDDIKLGFAPDGTMTGFVQGEAKVIRDGVDRISDFWKKEDRLPNTEEGTEIVTGLLDPWGGQIRYAIKTSGSFDITSDGPDQVWQSEYDIRAEVTVNSKTVAQQQREAASAESSDFLAWAHPETTWLERRKAELAAEGAAAAAAEVETGSVETDEINETSDFDYSIRWDIGGANLLQGASYFWFFTYVMLGTAILFVPVGWLYRPRTYLQEEGDAAGEAS